MVPFWTSFLIRTYAWMSILADEGMLNGLLMYIHVISVPWSLLSSPTGWSALGVLPIRQRSAQSR